MATKSITITDEAYNRLASFKGREYTKFWIVIPNKLIEKLGWKAGEDLEAGTKGDRLIIEKD